MKEELTRIAEKAVTDVVDAGIVGIRDVSNVFLNNYSMRRHVGFKFGTSLSGAFHDTKMYCNDIMRGKEPRVMKEAVTFTNK